MNLKEMRENLKWYQKLVWITRVRFPVRRILFVGRKNCGRSAASEYYFRKYCYWWDQLEACSSGVDIRGKGACKTFVWKNREVYAKARSKLSKQAVRFLISYEPKEFSAELLDSVDLVLTMDECVAKELSFKFRSMRYKIFTLKGFVDREKRSTSWNCLDIGSTKGKEITNVNEILNSILEVKKYIRQLVNILDYLEDEVKSSGVNSDGPREASAWREGH
ncbi:hypothetical protein HOC01_00340 [archaeon]|jgi:protein-tyrosine-phosphatase|nr:hypothetical protein [archaeon]MBT6698712.1 hypothetical protein [archaeon]